MKLTRAVDIAINVLMILGSKKKKMLVKDICKKLQDPFNHVQKVVQKLVRDGYVRSFRGKNGGIELFKRPETISIYDIISQIEGPIHIIDCLFDKKSCTVRSTCAPRNKFNEAQDKMIEVFKATSIKDLIDESSYK